MFNIQSLHLTNTYICIPNCILYIVQLSGQLYSWLCSNTYILGVILAKTHTLISHEFGKKYLLFM